MSGFGNNNSFGSGGSGGGFGSGGFGFGGAGGGGFGSSGQQQQQQQTVGSSGFGGGGFGYSSFGGQSSIAPPFGGSGGPSSASSSSGFGFGGASSTANTASTQPQMSSGFGGGGGSSGGFNSGSFGTAPQQSTTSTTTTTFGASPNIMNPFGSSSASTSANISGGFGSTGNSAPFGSANSSGFGATSSFSAPSTGTSFGTSTSTSNLPFGSTSNPSGQQQQQQFTSNVPSAAPVAFGASANLATSSFNNNSNSSSSNVGFGSSSYSYNRPAQSSNTGGFGATSQNNPFAFNQQQKHQDSGTMMQSQWDDQADEMADAAPPTALQYQPTSTFNAAPFATNSSSAANSTGFAPSSTANRYLSPVPEHENDNNDDQQQEEETLLKQKMEEKKLLQAKLEEKRRKLLERQRQKKDQSPTPRDGGSNVAATTTTAGSLNATAPPFMPMSSSSSAAARHSNNNNNSNNNNHGTMSTSDKDQQQQYTQTLAERNALRFGGDQGGKDRSKTKDLLPQDAPDLGLDGIPIAATNEREELINAVALVGKCEYFCPDEELFRRERENDIQQLEVPMPGQLHPPDWTLRNTVIKRFRRSAADYKLDVPEWVRPPDVLENVCGYLEEWVMDRDRQGPDPRFPGGQTPPSLEVYQFVWDRTRMIRKDLILQNYVGTGGNCDARAVRCHERIARWHAMCEHQLSHIPDFVTMQSQQNIQELGQTMKTLNQFYDDSLSRSVVEVPDEQGIETRTNPAGYQHGCTAANVQGNPPTDFDGTHLNNASDGPRIAQRIIGAHAVSHPTHGTAEPEMRGLYILLTMNNEGGMEVLKYAAKLFQEKPAIYNSKPVQLALEIFKAKKEYNYARFFAILKDPSTPYLFCCIMFKHVELMRKVAFRIMSKSFGAKKKDTGEAIYDAYPLRRLADLLCFEDMEEARDACRHYNISAKNVRVSSSSDDTAEIIFWRETDFSEPKHPEKGFVLALPPKKMTRTIEQKLKGATRLAVCRGEVSGEGATLDSVPPSPSKARVVAAQKPLLEEKRSDKEIQAAAMLEEEQRRKALVQKKAQLEEEERKAREQQHKEELARQKEAEAKRAAEIEKERQEKLLELKRQQEEELRMMQEREEAAKKAAEERALEEIRRKKLEEEAKRKAEEAHKKAEEEKRIEEERIRKEEERKKKEEEDRLEQLRQQRILEEKMRLEEERRQAVIRQELEAKRKREAEERRIDKEWEDKINAARKVVLWKRWKRHVSRQIEKTHEAVSSLRKLDPTFASGTLQLGRMLENARIGGSISTVSQFVPDELSEIRQTLERCIRQDLPKLSLSMMGTNELSRSNFAVSAPGSLHLHQQEKFTLLLKVAVLIPMATDISGKGIVQLLETWLNHRLGFNSLTRSQGLTSKNTSFETRTIIKLCRNSGDCADCDVGLFVIPPPWSTNDNRRNALQATASLLDDAIPRVVLVLGEFDPEGHEAMKGMVAQSIGGEGALPVIFNQVVSPDGLEKALEVACHKLVTIFVNEACIKIDRMSVPDLVSSAVTSSIWRRDSPNTTTDGSDVLECARSTVHAVIAEANSHFQKNSEMWSSWPPREFLSEKNEVEDYFSDQGILPRDWGNSLRQVTLENALSELLRRLTGSFRAVIDSLLCEAPRAVQDECSTLLVQGYYRRCLQRSLEWFASRQSIVDKHQMKFIYFPQGLLEVLLERAGSVSTSDSVPQLIHANGGEEPVGRILSSLPHTPTNVVPLDDGHGNKRRRADLSITNNSDWKGQQTSEGPKILGKKRRSSPCNSSIPTSSDLADSLSFSKRLEEMMNGGTVDLLVGDSRLSTILRKVPRMSSQR